MQTIWLEVEMDLWCEVCESESDKVGILGITLRKKKRDYICMYIVWLLFLYINVVL